jgi:hypothetical protein
MTTVLQLRIRCSISGHVDSARIIYSASYLDRPKKWCRKALTVGGTGWA